MIVREQKCNEAINKRVQKCSLDDPIQTEERSFTCKKNYSWKYNYQFDQKSVYLHNICKCGDTQYNITECVLYQIIIVDGSEEKERLFLLGSLV